MIKIAVYPNNSGSRYWRLIDPLKRLIEGKEYEVQVFDRPPKDEDALWADIAITQNIVDKDGIALLYTYQQERGLKIVVDSDDFGDLNIDNPHQLEHKITNAKDVISITMEIADMVTTTSPYLSNHLAKLNSNVVVLPNFMDMRRWDIPTTLNNTSEFRVGWAGSITHKEDVLMIRRSLIDFMRVRPDVKLVLIGDPRFSTWFEDLNTEIMLGVPFEYYPKRLHGLQLDVGLAPLVKNEFNRCKSAIKAMEYGISKTPVIASTIYPYDEYFGKKGHGKIGFQAPAESGWLTYLEYLYDHRDECRKMGRENYRKVKREYNLDNHIEKWDKAYRSLVE